MRLALTIVIGFFLLVQDAFTSATAIDRPAALGSTPVRGAMPETPVRFDGVEVLEDSGLTRAYRIAGKTVHIGLAVPLAGTTAWTIGQVGCLVLPRWFVEENALAGGRIA